MQNLVNDTPTPKRNYEFVDAIRCLSMMGIVFEHCSVLWGLKYNKLSETLIQTTAMQLFKFSTIAFFLIGGFLINHKFNEYSAGEYLKNRYKNTVKPWLFWVIVLIVLDTIVQGIIYLRFGHSDAVTNSPTYLLKEIGHILFYTSFWFIPNFLICITLLLIFRKNLYSIWLGISLGVISVFYSFNLYYNWITTEHSTALFGFVFYLWLGVMMNKHYQKLITWIKNLSWFILILINVGFFILAVAETIYLMKLGSKDSFNTLRFSNILYSLSMFVVLLKMGGLNVVQNKLNPRNTTFGIYLIHEILIIHLLPLIFSPLKIDETLFNAAGNVGLTFVRFIIIYATSFLLTVGISKTKMKWVVGQ